MMSTKKSELFMKIILDYIHLIGKGRLEFERLLDHPKLDSDRRGTIEGLQLLFDKGFITILPSLEEIIKGGTAVLVLTPAGKQQVLANKKKRQEDNKKAVSKKPLEPIDCEKRIITLIPFLRFKNNLTIQALVSFSKLEKAVVIQALNSLMKKQMIESELALSSVSDDEPLKTKITQKGTNWIKG